MCVVTFQPFKFVVREQKHNNIEQELFMREITYYLLFYLALKDMYIRLTLDFSRFQELMCCDIKYLLFIIRDTKVDKILLDLVDVFFLDKI